MFYNSHLRGFICKKVAYYCNFFYIIPLPCHRSPSIILFHYYDNNNDNENYYDDDDGDDDERAAMRTTTNTFHLVKI